MAKILITLWFLFISCPSWGSDEGVYVDQISMNHGLGCGPAAAANAIIYLSQKYHFELPENLNTKKALFDFFLGCTLLKTDYSGITQQNLFTSLQGCIGRINNHIELSEEDFAPVEGHYSKIYETVLDGGVVILNYGRWSRNRDYHYSGHFILAYDIVRPPKNDGEKFDFIIKAIDSLGGVSKLFPIFHFSPLDFNQNLQEYFVVETSSYQLSNPVILDGAILMRYSPHAFLNNLIHSIGH